jgi:hypothetical protein
MPGRKTAITMTTTAATANTGHNARYEDPEPPVVSALLIPSDFGKSPRSSHAENSRTRLRSREPSVTGTVCKNQDERQPMIAIVTILIAAAYAAVVDVTPSPNVQPRPAEPQHRLSELVQPAQAVDHIELYHIEHRGTLYLRRITLDVLLSMSPVTDYARIDKDNSDVIDDLYRTIDVTSVSPDRACPQSNIDVRWALVLTYRDGKKDALGIGFVNPCLQLSSRPSAVPASREPLMSFIQRTFPFTHAERGLLRGE